MPDTLTPNYSFTKPEIGSSSDSWGGKLNADLDLIDGVLKANSNVALAAQTKADAALPAAGYTPGDVLAKVKTVAGSGSGLDADTVDGKHANEFALASAVTAAAMLAAIKTVDGVGSGLDADLLAGQAANYYTDITARLGFTPMSTGGGTFTGGVNFNAAVTMGATLTVAGDITSLSDVRLKTNIQPLDPDAMFAALKRIGGFSYTMGGAAKVGVIAQDVRASGLSALVVEGEKGILSVNYQGLIPALIVAVNRLSERVAELEGK